MDIIDGKKRLILLLGTLKENLVFGKNVNIKWFINFMHVLNLARI